MAVTTAIAGGFKYLIRSGGPVTTTALSTFTIAGWLNPTTSTANETIEINGSAGAFINFDARNNQCIFDVNDNAGHAAGLSSITLISSGWFHYAGTWDGTTLRLYVNGVQDATSTPGFVFTGNNWSDMQIGPGDCQIQDACFYSAALSANEVAQLYAARSPGRRTNLVAYIPLFDATGVDYSGLGNSFTNNSAAAGTSNPAAGWGTQSPTWQKGITTGTMLGADVETATMGAGATALGADVETAAALGSAKALGADVETAAMGGALAALLDADVQTAKMAAMAAFVAASDVETAAMTGSAKMLGADVETAAMSAQSSGPATTAPQGGQGRRFGSRLFPALVRRG